MVSYIFSSDGRNGAAVDHVLAPMNRSCPVGYEKDHQLGNFFRASWPADGNSSKQIHQPLDEGAARDPLWRIHILRLLAALVFRISLLFQVCRNRGDAADLRS